MIPLLILAVFSIGTGIAIASRKPAKPPPPVTPPAPHLDPHLPPKTVLAVRQALASSKSPNDLENYAATLKPKAARTAAVLELRAKALRAQGVK